MKPSYDVKRHALQALEKEHKDRNRRVLERLRIFGWSFNDMVDSFRRARAAVFLSIGEAEAFDAEAAAAFVENADEVIAKLTHAATDDVVVIEIGPHYVCASLGMSPEAPALFALFDEAGKASLLPLEEDQTWKRDADGALRLRRRVIEAV